MAKKDKSAVKQDVTLIKGARTGGVRGSDSDPYFGVSNVDAFTKAFETSKGSIELAVALGFILLLISFIITLLIKSLRKIS